MTSKRKPFGLVATAVWAAFSGVVLLLSGFLLLLASQAPGVEALFLTVGGIVFCALGVVAFAAFYGLWSLQEWGRSVMFWFAAASIPLGVISIFPIWPGQEITTGNTVLQLAGIAIAVAIMSYLSRSGIKTLFSSYAA